MSSLSCSLLYLISLNFFHAYYCSVICIHRKYFFVSVIKSMLCCFVKAYPVESQSQMDWQSFMELITVTEVTLHTLVLLDTDVEDLPLSCASTTGHGPQCPDAINDNSLSSHGVYVASWLGLATTLCTQFPV